MSVSYAKPYKGIGMEGAIASWYARNTRRDLAEFRSLASRLSTEISPGSRILEVAPGPGYLSIELAKRGQYEVTGLDISKSFVEIARKNAAGESVCVDFRRGNASAMDGVYLRKYCHASEERTAAIRFESPDAG